MPNNKKKRVGPARSESSIMCWSIRARGLRTVRVWTVGQLGFFKGAVGL